MSFSPAVRTFRRSDRHQLTDLVNRHAAAVLPGVSTSVNTVLSSLEARPDEYVVDPWVAERLTLVTEHRGRVVAAAHLHRYRDEPDVGPDYRGAVAVPWFVHHPGGDPVSSEAADRLLAACLATATRWRARSVHADGALPCPGRVRRPRCLAARPLSAGAGGVRAHGRHGGAAARRGERPSRAR
ncbi:hypothetical protein SGRI78S_07327 [Streptomyces griseus subsp. griseus]